MHPLPPPLPPPQTYSRTTSAKAWGFREEQEEQEEKEHEQEEEQEEQEQQHWRPSARHDPTPHSAETGACGAVIKERPRYPDLRLPDHRVQGLSVGPRRWDPRCDLGAALRTALFLRKYRRPGGMLETGATRGAPGCEFGFLLLWISPGTYRFSGT
jgi:hypothetical protein